MTTSPYRRPRSRSTCCLSPPNSSEPRPRRRVRLLGFFSRRWARNAFRRRILPVPVTLKRLAAPRWVFILGIGARLPRGWKEKDYEVGEAGTDSAVSGAASAAGAADRAGGGGWAGPGS